MINFRTFAFALLLAAYPLAGQTQMKQFRIDAGQGRLTIYNGAEHTIVAFHLEHPDGRGVNKVSTIAPGKEKAYPVNATGFVIDGILWSDGEVTGPDRWNIRSHKKLWDEVWSGGPAYPTLASYADRGDSVQYARIWAKQYQRLYGKPPVIMAPVEPESCIPHDRPAGRPSLCPPPPHGEQILGYSWSCTSFVNLNPVSVHSGGPPFSACEAVFLVTTPTPIDVTTSTGLAACAMPNPYIPGKASLNAVETAFSGCVGAVISSLAEVQYNNGLPNALYADGTVVYPATPTLSQYSIDSCVLPLYNSPPEITDCQNN